MGRVANYISPHAVEITCRNFKCFGDELAGFQGLKPLNVIIGRNNAGKSTLLDLVQNATAPTSQNERGHAGKTPEFYVAFKVGSDIVEQMANTEIEHKQGNSNYRTTARSYWCQEEGLLDKVVMFSFAGNNDLHFSGVPNHKIRKEHIAPMLPKVGELVASRILNPFHGYEFRRILADRDIVPEPINETLEIKSNGSGATNVIQRFISRSSLDRSLIENVLLTKLNEIFLPDANYTRILVQQHGDTAASPWEIYLEEESKGRIRMSETGSGLKTILLVLLTHLYFHIYQRIRSG